MKSVLMGTMLLLSIGMARAAPELEQPRQVASVQTREAAPTRSVQAKTSSARKAEITRRMFWLALSLRSGG